MFKIFCFHSWIKKEILSIAYPDTRITNIKFPPGSGHHSLRILTQGTTTYILECSKCGKQKIEEYYGIPPDGTLT